MNECYICGEEAISRCYTCGQLICGKHGGENCERCRSAVMAGDPRGAHVSVVPLADGDARAGWWRPQQAEAYQPPACYECKGLARQVCQNCQNRYCREHAGPRNLCAACGRSARLGVLFFLLAIGMMFAVILLGGFVNW